MEEALIPILEGGAHPHLAVLSRTTEELPPVLASFDALGAKRDGWLVHRALPGEADAERATLADAGLEVAALEAQERLTVCELDPEQPPESYARAWEPAYRQALRRGFSAMWCSRFAITEDLASYESVLTYDRAWETWFRDRHVVTLCPYIVGMLDAPATLDRFESLAELHDAVVVVGGGTAALHSTAEYAAS
jgi:hypothetical protein